jgi:effector-binding domain-containing protein
MAEDIEFKELPAQPVLSIHAKVPAAELPEFFGESFSKLFPYLASLDEVPVAPPFALYHGMPTEEGFDMEVCVPTGKVLVEAGEIKASELPGGTFASTVHLGPYDEVADTYGALMAWIGGRGYAPSGPSREIYVVGMGQAEPKDYVTEVLIPVVKL